MTDARKLITLFENEKAYVHIVSSPLNDPTHRKFLIDQFKNLGTNQPRPFNHPRKIKVESEEKIDRTLELNPKDGRYYKRKISADQDRGKPKPKKLYIKARCCTLAPQDGQIHYFSAAYGVGIIFNADYCDPTTIDKHVYRENANSLARHRLYSPQRTREQIKVLKRLQFVTDDFSTATEKVKAYNRSNRAKNIVAFHTENESVKPSRAALEEQKEEQGGILAPRDDLITRLNALDFKHYVERELKIALPIVVGGPYITLRAYNKADQCKDVLEGLVGGGVAKEFADKIWRSGKITAEYINAIDDHWMSNYILKLMGKNHWDLARYLVNARNSLKTINHYSNTHKNTALHLAVRHNQPELVEALCMKGADLALKNAKGHSPLAMAIFNKYFNIVKVLIDHLKLQNTDDHNNQLSEVLANLILAEQYTLAESLLDTYHLRFLPTLKNYTLLHHVIPHKPELFKKLVRAGADICLQNQFGQTPLSMAPHALIRDLIFSDSEKLTPFQLKEAIIKLIDDNQFSHVEKFLDKKIKLLSSEQAGAVLQGLIFKERFKRAEKLLDARKKQPIDWSTCLDPNDKKNPSPLEVALSAGQADLAMKMLLVSYEHLAPLQLANTIKTLITLKKYQEIQNFLVDISNKLTWAQIDEVLLMLTEQREFFLTKFLLEGIDMLPCDPEQNTSTDKSGAVFDNLLRRGYFALIPMLLGKRKYISEEQEHPRRLYQLMSEKKYDSAILFAQYHTPHNYYDPLLNTTTLHLALKSGDVNLVSDLIKNKADIFIQDNNGQTPLALTIQSGHVEMVELLFQQSALYFKKNNTSFENTELTQAAQFLITNQHPLDLQLLFNIQGASVADKRRVAVLFLAECISAAKKPEDVTNILEQLEKLRPSYLHDRKNNGVSLRRDHWLGRRTSHTWIEIMGMGQARLLNLMCEYKNANPQLKAEVYLKRKSSGWGFGSSDSTAFKLFKKAKENDNPTTQKEIKHYIEETNAFKRRVIGSS